MSQINPTYIDIHPIKKFGRVLLHFCDLFVNFFLALAFFSMMVFPIARNIAGYDTNINTISENQLKMTSLLFENGLLEKEKEEDDFTTALTYSGNNFIKSFLSKDTKKDYFHHYFVDILQDEKSYLAFYTKNDTNGYFIVSDSVALKEEYQQLLLPLLDSKDTLSSKGQTLYKKLLNSVFPGFYSALIEDIGSNENIPSPSSLTDYRQYKKMDDSLENQNNWILSISCYISYTLASLIYFLLIPMVSKRGKTIAMMALGYERVGSDNLRVLKRKERWIQFFFYFFFHMSLILFLPMLFVSFAVLFSIPGILTLTLVGMALSLISFVYMFFDRLGRGLSDMLTKTCYIHKKDLENLALLKGYKVDHA
jgi:ABC-type multidrug transport system fused ATPase/permease subunit